jgi:asparagine synthase (glutamine-hydrolysing)
MCGFAGVVDPAGSRTADALSDVARAMADTLLHRGPDDGGVWVDPLAGVALGARRLAVLDLSTEGHQPMTSASGRFVLAYNGEIYNFRALRARLVAAGSAFRGGSDTEVLLAAIERWGVEPALQELNGMFAFALWDRTERQLHLGRDRLGEKPLYFGWVGGALVFGSELKALRRYPGFRPAVDRRTLARYLEAGYVPAPYSIYEGVSQLLPGTFLTIGTEAHARRAATLTRYWSAFDVAANGASRPCRASPAEITDRLEDLLGDAIAMRLRADVPVGAFLSGGIDSSTVVALMRSQSSGPVRSFTIAFDDPAYDESAYAAAVARHLGTDHTELRLTAGDARDVIARLPQLYDDPFADSSQIPTYLVSRLAREHVTVALSGDGGDELFGGYNRHAWGGPVWSAIGGLPLPLRRAAAGLLRAATPSTWDALFALGGPLLPRRFRLRNPGVKLHKLAGVLPAANSDELYRILTAAWTHPRDLVRGLADLTDEDEAQRAAPAAVTDLASQMMYLDLVGYLPDDILVKLDRASMGVSLETRVPMLDHRVVEMAWRIPASLKIKDGTSKWVLRQVLRRHVPDELVDRPKTGFGLPIGAWLRGPLEKWAEELLAPDRLEADGYLEPSTVQRGWREHLSGRRDLEAKLWPVLMFQAWLDVYRP